MTRTPQQPPDVPDAIEAIEHGPGAADDKAATQPEMAVLRGIVEHRIKRPPAGSTPETALSSLIEECRRHPAWPIVRADAAIFLYDAMLLLGAGEQAIRDALGFDACVRISQVTYGSTRWERVERPQTGNGPDR